MGITDMNIIDLTSKELDLLRKIMKLKENNMNKLKNLMICGELPDFIEGYLFACEPHVMCDDEFQSKSKRDGAKTAIAEITLAIETFDKRLL